MKEALNRPHLLSHLVFVDLESAVAEMAFDHGLLERLVLAQRARRQPDHMVSEFVDRKAARAGGQRGAFSVKRCSSPSASSTAMSESSPISASGVARPTSSARQSQDACDLVDDEVADRLARFRRGSILRRGAAMSILSLFSAAPSSWLDSFL